MAGELLFSSDCLPLEDMDGPRMVTTINRQIAKELDDAETLTQVQDNLRLSKTLTVLSKERRTFIDNKNPTMEKALIAALAEWKATHGSISLRKSTQGKQLPMTPVGPKRTCFACKKPGHKAADCWSAQKMSQPQEERGQHRWMSSQLSVSSALRSATSTRLSY